MEPALRRKGLRGDPHSLSPGLSRALGKTVRRTRRPRRGNLTATVPYRAVSFERLRDCGLNLAWGHDPLTSSSNRGLRIQKARRLRAERRTILAEVRAEERQVAMIMAEDRFALTLAGLFVLQNAESGKA
jgi:hypothetical protein